MAVDRAALTGSLHRLVIVRARQEADVVDLGDSPCEELDRSGGEISLVVIAKRRVVRAVELVDVASLGVGVGQDAVHVPTVRLDPRGEVGHLAGRQDAVEIRADRDAVMAVEVRELPVR